MAVNLTVWPVMIHSGLGRGWSRPRQGQQRAQGQAREALRLRLARAHSGHRDPCVCPSGREGHLERSPQGRVSPGEGTDHMQTEPGPGRANPGTRPQGLPATSRLPLSVSRPPAPPSPHLLTPRRVGSPPWALAPSSTLAGHTGRAWGAHLQEGQGSRGITQVGRPNTHLPRHRSKKVGPGSPSPDLGHTA